MDATPAASSASPPLPRRHRLYLSLLLLVTALLLGSWVCTSELVRQQQRQTQLQHLATSVADRISISIRNATLPLYALGELTLQGQGRIDGLAALADKMRAANPTILNISVMPGGVVRQIEPLIPHAMALGHDMFLDPERVDNARLARDRKKLTVTGPYQLIQGGQGLISRLPLYQQDRFWGFVSIVFEFQPPFELILQRYIAHNDMLYQVSHPSAAAPFFANTEHMPTGHAQARIELPNNHWQLQMAYAPAFNGVLTLKVAAAVAGLLLAGYVFYRILKAVAIQNQLESVLTQSGELSARHQAQKRMLAQVSHDLRTPMQHVLNAVKQMGENSNQSPAPVHTIEQNVQYQLNLIDQLLDYSAKGSRELRSHPAPGYLYAFLAQLREQADFLAQSRGNQLHVDISQHLPAIVSADFRQLQQVLINLLGNASKFTHQGDIEFSVQPLAATHEQTHRLRFTVQDNGPGMPADPVGHQHENKGYGLGLMIVTDLLRLMNSQLIYRERPEGGSRFYFDLELAAPDATPDAFIEQNVGSWDGEGLNLMLVDQEPTCREQLTELLLGYGADCYGCASLVEASAALESGHFDLIITDMALADADAWALLQLTRSRAKPVPVLLLTARPAFSVDPPSDELAFAAELLKPATTTQLIYQIKQLTTATETA